MRWLLAIGLVGCSTATEQVPDSGVDGGSCELVGPWRACGVRCDQGCDDDSVCAFELGVCAPAPAELGMDTCVIRRDFDTTNHYCYGNDRFCATTAAPNDDGSRSGTCVPRAACEVSLAEFPFTCFYADGADFGRGPPAFDGECGGEEEASMCGGRCGGCEPVVRGREFQFCVGVSSTRGAGVCAVSPRRCDLRYPIGDARFSDTPERGCLLTPEEPDVGWVVLMETCLAYRAQFDGIECRDESWRIEP
ncbi:MAG: hypothetical protein AAGE52_31510 [Myxococcota bacterium]